MNSLKDQVVCITGASRGLGRALAEAFGAEGCHLVLGARNQAALEDVARELPSSLAVQCDVREVEDIRALVDAALAAHERLDIMINNASVAHYGSLLSTNEADFDQMVATNLKGTFFGCQVALEAMLARHQGLIVNISSIAGRRYAPNESAYSATKWAVQGLTGALRLEAAAHNIRVTSVVAGGINTPVWKEKDFLPFPPEVEPERDFMDPKEVAAAIVNIARHSKHFVIPELVCVPLLARERDLGS